MQFKVGDKVRIAHPPVPKSVFSSCIGFNHKLGTEGVITDMGETYGHIYVDGSGCYQHEQLQLITKEMKPTRTFTNSQKIRLRLKTYWENNDTEHDDDFEEYYTAFTDAVLDNLEFLADTFKL